MNIIDRVKNIFTNPKQEWQVIDSETATPQSLLVSYVLPLALVAALGTLVQGLMIASRLFGSSFFVWMAVVGFLSLIIGYYIAIYVIDMLASRFNSEKNLNKSAQLVAYAYTPVWIAGFLGFIPFLGFFIMIAGWVYSVYLFYLGLGVVKRTPEDKKIIYMVIAFIVMLIINAVVSTVLSSILIGTTGMGSYGRGPFGF